MFGPVIAVLSLSVVYVWTTNGLSLGFVPESSKPLAVKPRKENACSKKYILWGAQND